MSICPISDFSTAKAAISATGLAPFSMADAYVAIAQKTNIDFSPTIRLMNCLPPFMHGHEHQDMRRRMAARIADTMAAQRAAARGKCSQLVDALFRPGSEFDTVSGFARPLWRAVSEVLLDNTASDIEGLDLAEEIPVLFSSVVSLTRRKSINERIERFIMADTARADDRLASLALSVLGARPFVGAMALSIFHAVERHGPCPASEIPWSATFSDTPLTYVDRVALDEVALGTQTLRQGERARIFTSHPSYDATEQRRLLFGLGSHGCLGKSISEYSWTYAVRTISGTMGILHAKSIEMEADSEPFTMPHRATLMVTS